MTTRRVSQVARIQIEKEENRHLGCYTFDELLAQDADFNGYLDWLEAEVKRRKIDTHYVPLACTKEEIDSLTKCQISISHYDKQNGWIDGYIDRWLDDPAKEHISILGEFGTGKTWFALHYAWLALQRYRDAQQRGVELPRLPLVIPLRDYAKAVSVESLFSEFFFRKHEIPLPGYSAFEQLNRMGRLLLIFDGFDEMAARVDRQKMINNFWELAKVVVPGAKVILTCRTEHFPEAQEGRALLNAELQASIANLTGETPQFEVLELEKFTDDQIRRVLSFQATPKIVEQVMSNSQLVDLARRPVMAELILEALPNIQAGKPIDMSRVYLYAVQRKMERDIKAERTFTSLADKLYFLCELSWEMLSTEQMSLNYRLFPDRIRKLFDAVVQEEKDLDHWHYDMMGQTMLIRNADGDYTPAHKSFLEFFVAYKFAAELGILASDFTELAQSQSHLDVSALSQNYTWSSYANRQIDQQGLVIRIPPLKSFSTELITGLCTTFGKFPLSKLTFDLLVPMLESTENTTQKLLEIVEATRFKTEKEIGCIGGNAVTLLLRLDLATLENYDLRNTVIVGADFINASLRNTNFANANLSNSHFDETFGSITSVSFSSNEDLLATGDFNGEIRLWQITEKKQRLVFKEHTNWVRSVSFSPDGKTIASGSDDKTVKIWDVNTGQCLFTLEEHTARVQSVNFSPDGKTITSGSDDKTVKIWDVNTGQCLLTLGEHASRVRSVSFSPDGKTIASGSDDRTVKIWDVNTGQCLLTLEGHTEWVRSIAFSPSGQLLASGSEDRTVRIWQTSNGECKHVLQGHTGWVRSIAFSRSGQLLASGSEDQTVRIWRTSNGQCRDVLQGHTKLVRSIAFSSSDQLLASGSEDQTVRLWDINTGRCLDILQGHIDRVWSVAFSPSSQYLASGSEDETVRLWDINTGQCLHTLGGRTDKFQLVTINPNGQIVANDSKNQTIKLWDGNTGQFVQTWSVKAGRVRAVVFMSNGQIVATSIEDQTIKLWNVSTGQCMQTLLGHKGRVRTVAFSPTGQVLVSGSEDQTIKLWNVSTGQCLYTLQGHMNWIRTIAFSPNGQVLASGGEDQTVKLWNVSTGQCMQTLLGHKGRVRTVAFSPNGQVLASGGEDQTVKLWNVSTGQCLYTLQGHMNWILAVAFSPNTQMLASGSEDGTVKLWDIDAGVCINTLRIPRPYEGMNIFNTVGLTDIQRISLKALGALECED
ncbi:NACHT domain-containing protein [Nostoc sp. ATCC 53789]|uniref:WD40 domain-containing protein n=1 Tax=Nostoc sp. ATCC 53789 TaxID=76335 RepID=UPI00132F3F83|nr:NACHT domain-containing protein [Nostoc sp. ATCC 53789]QHG21028.1 NACHT domain-containing protein [Nostoc sp. ATCC 53789]